MHYFKFLLDFYIKSSIHVALSVFALVQITGYLLAISTMPSVSCFAFFGTIVGYNFVKYDALVRTQKIALGWTLKIIAVLSFCSFLFAIYFFLELALPTKIMGFLFLVIVLLYTLPFFPNRKNARNWAGIKIYMVTLCWVGVTVILPVINEEINLEFVTFLVALQRFLLVFVLVLIFEIIDLPSDDVHLKTVPQTIGIKKTKQIGILLLVIFILFEFLDGNYNAVTFFLKIGIAITTAFFLIFASEKRSIYYSTFWVESIPIIWWILLIFLR